MSKTTREILYNPMHPGIYAKIWNGYREDMRRNETNKCFQCGHQILLSKDDHPRVIGRMGNKHKMVYYHGEPCQWCKRICGDSVINGDSKPL